MQSVMLCYPVLLLLSFSQELFPQYQCLRRCRSGISAVILIEVIKRLGKIEPGAAMGVVFTGMFALGVLILEQTDTSKVHLDVEHALMGNLESLIWLKAQGWQSLFDLDVLKTLPDELFRIIFVCGFILSDNYILALVKIVTFDEEYARTIGIHSSIINFSSYHNRNCCCCSI